MSLKRLLPLLLIAHVVTCRAATLVDAGRSEYEIVLAADAIPAEKTAAEELRNLIREISSVELPITEKASGKAIYVGQSPESARALGVSDWNTLKTDEIRLRTVNDNLYLAGDRPRGTLYAVYELLEREFGVRFWTAEVTKIPKRTTLELPQLDIRYAPPIEVRSTGYQLLTRDPRFCARSRNNGHGVTNNPKWGGAVLLIGDVHTFTQNAPLISRKEFDEHPEYFAEVRGRRTRDGQLCLSNPELRKVLTARVLERLRKNPDPYYISVSQNDFGQFCSCRECTEFIRKNGNLTDLLIDAINEVAASVAKEFPGVYVETLAYQATAKPPRRIRAADNVVIRYCTIRMNALQKIDSSANRAIGEQLKTWSRHAKHLMVWNYVTNFTKYYQPHPNWLTIGENLRLFRDCGAISVYEQGAWNGGGVIADLPELRAYLESHLLWNPDADTNALIREFTDGYYGPAAKNVQQYIELMCDSLKRHPDGGATCYSASTGQWLDADALIEAWQSMESAWKQFGNDPVLGPRIAAASIPINAALAERGDLWTASARKAYSELADIKFEELVETAAERMKAAGVTRLQEGGTTPDEWAAEVLSSGKIARGELPNDGETPPVAGRAPYYAWSMRRLIDRKPSNTLLWEEDPAASVGKALKMENTHTEWNIQCRNLPVGTYDVYVDVRCDSRNPEGNAMTVGFYDWAAGRGRLEVRIPAKPIAGKKYHTMKVGTIELKPDYGLYIAPVNTPAVQHIWIDRLILIPQKKAK